MFDIAKDLRQAGIEAVISDNIARDAFQKYAYVAPMAACGLYYDAKADVFQQAGEERELFVKCMQEMDALATAMESELEGLVFEPVRMGRKAGVAMPNYEMIAKKFGLE